ncbi:hypothetical protein HYPSUDRAFT_39953 [Hypholoma sublateritium FD-334 SS-4]|uniref:Uncharacterized protein n=1 Tax=Hypholoma sublateritium (strain FD-334 SS-4) TaxID=945553 RepID=A0A0D2L7R8_HYPSF|nr:hypothetical protein HYPSUDRAFT_39953 [Hypholoma sublateritium FD-334 SS-4]
MDAPATPHQNQIPTKKSTGDMSEHGSLARSQPQHASPPRHASARVDPDANPNLRSAQDSYAAWPPGSGSGSSGIAPLRVRRHESTPAGEGGAMAPPAGGLAPGAPPFVTSASDGSVPRARRGTYDESDAPTTDDEYQVLTARADGEYPARASARGWAAVSASGGASVGSDGEYTPRRHVPPIPAPPGLAVAVSASADGGGAMSPTMKSAGSTSSFARFLTRPKKKATLESEEASESDSAWAASFAKEKKRAEKEKDGRAIAPANAGMSFGMIGAMALSK